MEKVTNMRNILKHRYIMYRINRGERKCNECGKWFTTESVGHQRSCGLWTCVDCDPTLAPGYYDSRPESFDGYLVYDGHFTQESRK